MLSPSRASACETVDSSDVGITLNNAESGDAVRVMGVRKHSLAYQCGVRAGDVITHINGIAVYSRSDVDIECTKAHLCQNVKLTIAGGAVDNDVQS